MKRIYLDHNATTPLAPKVQEAMLPFIAEHYGNPSSSHSMGRAAYEAIEDARMHVAAAIGADRDEIFFTSGGTESNNLAILGALVSDDMPLSGHVVTTQVEHPAVTEPIKQLERWGMEVTWLPTDSHGVISIADVESAIRGDTRMVAVMHANNETGVLQPITEISDLLRDREILFHTDASQALGKVDTNVDTLGVDLLAIAGHKCYAPKGVGALYARFGTQLRPCLYGAGHERGLRPGTENVASIVGLGHACRLLHSHAKESQQHLERLRDRLLSELLKQVTGLTVNGQDSERLPNTLSVIFPGVKGFELLARVPEICASTGSACHSGSTAMSSTLDNLGLSLPEAQATVRFSVGWYNTEQEMIEAAALISAAWNELSGTMI